VLAGLGEDVAACGRGVPPDLARRLDARLGELARAHRRRALAAGAATAVAAVVASVVLVGVVRARALDRDAARAATELNRLLDEGNVEAAEAFRADLSGPVADAPGMAEALARLDDARRAERGRKDRLARALERLAGREPDRPDPPELAEARALVRLEPEQRAADEAGRRYTDRFAAARREAEQDFLRRVDDVRPDVERLEALAGNVDGAGDVNGAGLPDLDRQAGRARARLERLVSDDSPKLGDAARQAARALMARVEGVENRRRARQRQIQIEGGLTQAGAMADLDPAPFARALKELADASPDTPRGRGAKQALAEQPLWADAVAWLKALDAWKAAPGTATLIDPDPLTAAARAKECRQVLAAHPNLPDTALARRYLAHLEAIARREGLVARKGGKATGARADLEAVWQEELASGLRVVRTFEGKSYYFVNQPVPRATSRTFHCYLGFERESAREVSIPKAQIRYEEPAPQCAIATQVNEWKILRNLRWEDAAFAILHHLYEPERISSAEFDPIYRYALLKSTAELAAEGSAPLASALRPLLDRLAQFKVDTSVFWMNPDDKPANHERPRAADFFRALPPLSKAEAEVAASRQQLLADLAGRRTPVGWLAREGSAWRLRADRSVDAGAGLWVVVPPPAAGRPALWARVGTAGNGSGPAALEGSDPGALVEGRPVFADNQPADERASNGR
jgi:hypothetical protein